MRTMLTHNQIWTAIDRLAARAKLSPSGLPRKPASTPPRSTSPSASRRKAAPRWPSTESVAKSLRRDRHQGRHLRDADHRRRQGRRTQSGAADRLRRSRRRRLFRRRRLSGRQGLGRDRLPRGHRRTRLCAGNFRRLDEAGLPRRRRHHRLAGGDGAQAATASWSRPRTAR